MSTFSKDVVFRVDVPRPKDVGQPKATVAADFVMKRVPGVKVTPLVHTF